MIIKDIEDIVGLVVTFCMVGFFTWMLIWAHNKEQRLGIDGMSSERILVREELKSSK